MLKRKNEKNGTVKGIRLAALISAFVMLLSGAAVFAWLYQGRYIAAVGEISNPTSIQINAAHQEDIRYLDLKDIDVNLNDHKDYVFCIIGDNVSYYGLQLAFTTNNQFEYEIYPAVEKGIGAVPGDALAVVEYSTHDGSGVKQYYVNNGTAKLAGDFINKKTGSEALAYTIGDAAPSAPKKNMHNDTYYTEKNVNGVIMSAYGYVNKYAEPLYWQTSSNIYGGNDFCHYYVLRVKWDQNTASNSKETDIIYISARNIGG